MTFVVPFVETRQQTTSVKCNRKTENMAPFIRQVYRYQQITGEFVRLNVRLLFTELKFCLLFYLL